MYSTAGEIKKIIDKSNDKMSVNLVIISDITGNQEVGIQFRKKLKTLSDTYKIGTMIKVHHIINGKMSNSGQYYNNHIAVKADLM